jgi:hypothetical protein
MKLRKFSKSTNTQQKMSLNLIKNRRLIITFDKLTIWTTLTNTSIKRNKKN